MRYKLLAALVFISCGLQAQQVNPVPDYVFANRMSVGRNAVTDTLAYFSIGPRYGAIRGFMPPMVVDTALVTGGTKRNGLTIFSIQKNKYVYWDSVGSKWAEMAGTGGTAINSGDTASMLSPYTRGSGTTNYVPKFTGTRTFGNSQIFDNGTNVGISTASPATKLQVSGEIMADKLLIDTIGGIATNSPWRATGVKTNISGVTHWWGLTDAGVSNNKGGGDFTFFKSLKGDSALTSASEIWYFEWRGKYRNNHSTWSTNDSSKLADDVVLYTTHSNTTPTAIRTLRAKNSSSTITTYLEIDPTTEKVSVLNSSFYVDNGIRSNSGENYLGSSADVGNYRLQVFGNIYTNGTVNDFGKTSSGATLQLGAGLGNKEISINAGDGTGIGGAFALYNSSTVLAYMGHASYITGNQITGNGLLLATANAPMYFLVGGFGSSNEAMRINSGEELIIGGGATDAGAFALQVTGAIYNTTTLTTGAPTSGTAKPWRLGEAATVSPTSPNRTIRVEIDGTVYYLHAKTTND